MRAQSLLASLLATAALALVQPAQASTTYPQVVSDALGMPCVPPCTICHKDNVGGPGTVVTTFGLTAKNMFGQTGAFNDAKLRDTLQKMAAMGINSDTEPETDVAELTAGTDPSVVGGEVCNGPKYGCGAATIAAVPAKRGGDSTAAAAAVLTALAGALMLRRRRH